MLTRFKLYGFLKNQRYFEPFLVLAFLEHGLLFAHVGALVAVRELARNVLEIPSGAIADLWGRRRAMVASFSGYLIALLVFSLADGQLAAFVVAMALLGVGDAFRTGTHKAMIFDWLAEQGRQDDRVEVYGATRSWSQLGSAVSIPLASGLVLLTGRYSDLFAWTAIPWTLGLLNLATYPRSLDGESAGVSVAATWTLLRTAFGEVLGQARLRRLVGEGMAFDGSYRATRDYLQPILQGPVTIGGAYVALHLLGAASSRLAHRLVAWSGSPEAAARRLWWAALVGWSGAAVLLVLGQPLLAALGFVALGAAYNAFRPILVARVDAVTEKTRKATVLSLESQASSLATMVIAPLAGLAVDAWGLWVAAAVAAGIAVPFAVRGAVARSG